MIKPSKQEKEKEKEKAEGEEDEQKRVPRSLTTRWQLLDSALRHHRLARSLIKPDAESLKPACDAPIPWIEETIRRLIRSSEISVRIGAVVWTFFRTRRMSLLHNQTAFLASFWRQSSPHTAREDAIRHSDRDCAKTSPTKRNSTTDFSIAFDASVTWFPPDSREILFFFFKFGWRWIVESWKYRIDSFLEHCRFE